MVDSRLQYLLTHRHQWNVSLPVQRLSCSHLNGIHVGFLIETRLFDQNVNRLLMMVANQKVVHIDIKLRCRGIDFYDELVRELVLVREIVGDDNFSHMKTFISRVDGTWSCHVHSKYISGHILISDRATSCDYRVEVFTDRQEFAMINTYDSFTTEHDTVTYDMRFAASLQAECHTIHDLRINNIALLKKILNKIHI